LSITTYRYLTLGTSWAQRYKAVPTLSSTPGSFTEAKVAFSHIPDDRVLFWLDDHILCRGRTHSGHEQESRSGGTENASS
jgi:hypothetical protein